MQESWFKKHPGNFPQFKGGELRNVADRLARAGVLYYEIPPSYVGLQGLQRGDFESLCRMMTEQFRVCSMNNIPVEPAIMFIRDNVLVITNRHLTRKLVVESVNPFMTYYKPWAVVLISYALITVQKPGEADKDEEMGCIYAVDYQGREHVSLFEVMLEDDGLVRHVAEVKRLRENIPPQARPFDCRQALMALNDRNSEVADNHELV